MDEIGIGSRIRVYIGEYDQWHHGPLYLAILNTLRSEGAAGATVVRGIAGFGAHTCIHTATLVDVSNNLPLVVEWIDTPERVARVLPKIQAMVSEGMITREEVEVPYYKSRVVSDITNQLRAREVMTTDVVTVRPDTSLREAVELLIGKDYRALPVVDDRGRVVGIVSNGDLVERGGLRVRLDLFRGLSGEQHQRILDRVEDEKTVGEVMTSPVVTIHPEANLADVAHLMVCNSLKRVPVVDSRGTLLGIVSRADLLRTRSDAYPRLDAAASPRIGQTIGEVMRTDVPVVGRAAPLARVLDAVVSTRLNRALVVDDARHVLGVITDAELLRRLSPEDHPGVVQVLMQRIPLVHLGQSERSRLAHALGKTAEELMTPNITAVPAETPIGEAIETMIKNRAKILPVVDSGGRLLGAADRADLLRSLLAHP